MGGEHGHRSHTDEQGEDQAIQGTLYPCKVEEKGDLGWGLQGEETVALLFPNTEATRVVGRGSHGSWTTLRSVASLLQRGLHTGEFYLEFKELNMAPRERWARKVMTYFLKIIIVYMHACAHAPKPTCRGRRTLCSQLSSSIMGLRD